jgi:Zn-dependent protease with chaperone function
MINGQSALILNLLTVAVLAFIVANIFVSIIFCSVKNNIQGYTVSTRKSLLWLCVLSPWIIALAVTLFFSPFLQSVTTFVWLTELAHWHHPNTFYFLSWHSLSLIIFIGFSIYIAAPRIVVAYKSHQQIKFLRTFATKKSEDVFIIDSLIPTAFTGGLITSSCFVSTGLIKQLDSDDVEIIIQHELAHLYYMDPIKKWMFSFFSAYFTSNVKQILKSMMAISMEQAADSFFVKNQKQAHDVASTLVRFTKLAAKYSIHEQYQSELLVHFGAQSIEQRILQLLSVTPLKPFPVKVVLLGIMLLVAISTTSVDSLHHAIETLFHH